MTTVGGQAVLEGVMMRGPSNWAVAVRKPDGDIAQVHQPIASPMARHFVFRLPVIRGVIALGESLAIGFRALAISANYAAQDPDAEPGEVQTEIGRGQIIFSFAIAIGFAILLFKVSPALITDWIGIDAGWFVLVEGLIRVTIFVLYLSVISLFPDLRRVFQYHAAEHKAINAYEAGEELTPENVQRYSLLHVRCGTAFLLYVMAHVTCSCGNEFWTRSTKPELHVEICAECHPFYTGKQKLVDTGGRVERFQRRLEKAGGSRRG